MKKITLMLIFAISSFASFSQITKGSLSEGRRAFTYVGSNYCTTPNETILSGFSGELGFWGTTKATSYSLTFDVVNPVGSSPSYWAGIKPYFTAFDNGKISYMLYAMPKFNVNDLSQKVIEVGFNPNYTVSNHVLFGLTIGGQYSGVASNSTFSPFLGVGFIILK